MPTRAVGRLFELVGTRRLCPSNSLPAAALPVKSQVNPFGPLSIPRQRIQLKPVSADAGVKSAKGGRVGDGDLDRLSRVKSSSETDWECGAAGDSVTLGRCALFV